MKTITALMGACAALTLTVAAPALAQDAPWYAAKSDGDWLVRVRAVGVLPDEDLSLDQDAAAGIDISDTLIPELDITYFFTPNLALELILGTTPHDLRGRGGSIDGDNLGDVWLLPPTLTAQYHVTQLGDWTGVEGLSKLKPYFGAGINYTIFYGGSDGDFDDVSLDDTFGWALQAGLDYEVAEGIFLNVDVKKVFLEADVSVNSGAATGEAQIDPWLVGVGVGYRF